MPYEAWDASQVIVQECAGACWGFEVTTNNNPLKQYQLKQAVLCLVSHVVVWKQTTAACRCCCSGITEIKMNRWGWDLYIMVLFQIAGWTMPTYLCDFLLGVETECLSTQWFKAICVNNKAIIIKQNNNKEISSQFLSGNSRQCNTV